MDFLARLLAAQTEFEFFALICQIQFGISGIAEVRNTGTVDNPGLQVSLRRSLAIPKPNGGQLLTNEYVSRFRLYANERLEWDILDCGYESVMKPGGEKIIETIIGLKPIKTRLRQMQKSGQGLLIAGSDTPPTKLSLE